MIGFERIAEALTNDREEERHQLLKGEREEPPLLTNSKKELEHAVSGSSYPYQ